jgi:NADH:ubiquinone oxidoreductase subunit B-like Fe-S oxidoreductase
MRIQNIIKELEIDMFKFVMVVRSSTRQCEVLNTMGTIE